MILFDWILIGFLAGISLLGAVVLYINRKEKTRAVESLLEELAREYDVREEEW